MADISAAAEVPEDDPALESQAAAARRFEARTSERRERIGRLGSRTAVADTPERLAKRSDRIRRYNSGEELRSAPVAVPSTTPEGLADAGPDLEKVINSSDFVDIRYLEAGVAAARAVGRVNIRNRTGRVVGYGTASMVSSRLALTNHHVLPTADVAQVSVIEFNYQDGVDGQPLQPRVFRLDPDSFYLADRDRDFALVAVAADDGELDEFGFNRLYDAEGKAVIGEYVTIVQHPKGEKKQVSLRENRVVDVLDSFLHYETDTEPGSSGSPVFNDQWEVVALHHASVPAPDHAELGNIMNEGVRVSALLKAARDGAAGLPAPMASLLDGLFEDERSAVGTRKATPSPTPDVTAQPQAQPQAAQPLAAQPLAAQPLAAQPRPAGLQSVSSSDVTRTESTVVTPDGIRLTVPVEITVHVGPSPVAGGGAEPSSAPDEGSAVILSLPIPAGSGAAEAIRIDPDYSDRRGYDPAFLGSGGAEVPLPILPPALLGQAALLTTPAGAAPIAGPRHVLRYHHYSVVMNRERALAFFTAVNVDGKLTRRLRREPDRWKLDPRIPVASQTGEAVYVDNDLDRGHLVRRLDPAWGTSDAAAKVANDDTFHFTNCSPQHKDFNQNQTTWAGLEDFVLENAENHDLKVNVFSGPVFAADDDLYRGVQLPRQFWKVVVMARRDGTLSATGYLLSQAQLIEGLEAAEEFSYGAYRTFQVPVSKVEQLTGLSFGTLAAADPLARQEAFGLFREVGAPEDLVL